MVGIDGPALFIDQDLLRGVSWPSVGFGSPALCTAGTDFVVRNIEARRGTLKESYLKPIWDESAVKQLSYQLGELDFGLLRS